MNFVSREARVANCAKGTSKGVREECVWQPEWTAHCSLRSLAIDIVCQGDPCSVTINLDIAGIDDGLDDFILSFLFETRDIRGFAWTPQTIFQWRFIQR